jgi:peroxiredoxin
MNKWASVAASVLAIFMAASTDACKGSSPTSPPNGSSFLTFSGVITSAGQPMAGVDVYLSLGGSRKTSTAADGKFSFSELPSQNYVITPSKVGFAFSPSNYELGSSSRSDLNFSGQPATAGTDVGAIATNFTAKDQNGTFVSLYDSHGKVVLLDFTADWCTDCRAKAETAEEFYQKYKDKGFAYILVVIEGNPSDWATAYKLTFPVLDDNSQAIYSLYRTTSLPLPHVLDRNMTIRYKKEGWNKAEVESIIANYL